MRLLLAALAALLSCPAAAAAAPFGEVPFQPLRDGRVVKCLEPAGADRIGFVHVLEDGSEAVALVRVAADGALAIEAAAALGPTLECPSIAAAASGAAVIAHASLQGRGMELVVALREPGGQLGRALHVPSVRRAGMSEVDVAIASSGAAVVAWTETGPRRGDAWRVRVIRRTPGGAFGRPETLRPSIGLSSELVVGVDDAGRATVAWQPDGELLAATAEPGAAFGAPQRLPRSYDFGSAPALAVADDGGALIAYESVEGIRLFERVPGIARMTPLPGYRSNSDLGRDEPIVALAPGGGASVAWWRMSDGVPSVEVALRPPGGTFQPPQVLRRSTPGAAGLDDGRAAADVRAGRRRRRTPACRRRRWRCRRRVARGADDRRRRRALARCGRGRNAGRVMGGNGPVRRAGTVGGRLRRPGRSSRGAVDGQPA